MSVDNSRIAKNTACLGLARGVRPDLGGDWDTKLSHEDINWSGKTVHLFRC